MTSASNWSKFRALHFEHFLIAFSLILGPYRDFRNYSIGLVVIWLAIHLVKILRENRSHDGKKSISLAAALFIGLLLTQLRVLLTMPDNDGATRYLLIAFALLVGANLSRRSWKTLFHYITISGLITAICYWANWQPEVSSWLIKANKYTFKEGYGGINMLGSVLDIFLVVSTYTLRTCRMKISKIYSSLAVFSIFSLILATNSRMAVIAPILAVYLSWLYSTGRYQLNQLARPKKWFFSSLCIFAPFVACWFFVVRPDWSNGMLSDAARLEIWVCSLKNSIFAGNNRIAYGIGYMWQQIQAACGQWQAHSSYIHFVSMHGMLGIMGIMSIIFLAFKGARDQLRRFNSNICFWNCNCGEVTLGCMLVVAITALSSTTYLGGYLNPMLMGLVFSMSLVPTFAKSIQVERDL